MKFRLFAAVTVTAFIMSASAASAGIYADDMTRCIVKSATPTDRADLVKWIFAMIGSNPQVEGLSTSTPAQEDAFNRRAAAVLERLVHVDCRKESIEALRYEGEAAMNESFKVLGQTAAKDLMSHPAVTAKMGGFASHIDVSKWESLGKAAGVFQPAK